MNRKVRILAELIATLCFFAILAYLAAAVALGTVQIYDRLLGR